MNTLFLFREDSTDVKSTTSSILDEEEAEIALATLSKVTENWPTSQASFQAVGTRYEPYPQEEDDGPIEYKLKLIDIDAAKLQRRVTQMNYRLTEGMNEAIYRVGIDDDGTCVGLSDEELIETIQVLYKMSATLNVDLYIMSILESYDGKLANLLVRRTFDTEAADVRVCAIGDEDAGKSTLLGVLITGELDNGKGSARIFRYRHEFEEGTTSSVYREVIGFDENGQIVNGDLFLSSVADHSSKLIMLVDLAGKARYLKTKLFGLMGQAPDFVMVAVDGEGISEYTLEHLSVLAALRIPHFVVITKTDLYEDDVIEQTINDVQETIQTLENSSSLLIVEEEKDLEDIRNLMSYESAIPVFRVSSVTGEGLPLIKVFLNGLEKAYAHREYFDMPSEFTVDEIFKLKSVGLIVGGTVTRGTISIGDRMHIGPDQDGYFIEVGVRSIHVYKRSVSRALAGQAASLALTNITRKEVRKGMVLLSSELHPKACRCFDAEIILLKGQALLQVNEEPIVHIGTICQAARILTVEGEDDQAKVTFQFVHHPEYIKIGEPLIFRTSARTKGMGRVVEIDEMMDNLIV